MCGGDVKGELSPKNFFVLSCSSLAPDHDGVIRFSLRWLEVGENLKRRCPKLSRSTE